MSYAPWASQATKMKNLSPTNSTNQPIEHAKRKIQMFKNLISDSRRRICKTTMAVVKRKTLPRSLKWNLFHIPTPRCVQASIAGLAARYPSTGTGTRLERVTRWLKMSSTCNEPHIPARIVCSCPCFMYSQLHLHSCTHAHAHTCIHTGGRCVLSLLMRDPSPPATRSLRLERY